jgi:hypothetical protein
MFQTTNQNSVKNHLKQCVLGVAQLLESGSKTFIKLSTSISPPAEKLSCSEHWVPGLVNSHIKRTGKSPWLFFDG